MLSMTSTPASASSSASAAAEPADARKLVRAAERDPWNRLHSIVSDAEFVNQVAENYPDLPVVRESDQCPPA